LPLPYNARSYTLSIQASYRRRITYIAFVVP
jgi:hypothetical protein